MEEKQEVQTDNQTEQDKIEQETETDKVDELQTDDSDKGERQEKSEFDQLLDDLSDPDLNDRKEDKDKTEPEQDDNPEKRQSEFEKPEQNYDELEKELLSEARTDRSRNRIKKFIADHKALETTHKSMSNEYQTIASAIAQTGMDERGIAEVLNFCGLAASNDANKMRVALEILDKTREDLMKRINPVDKFEDIKKAVDDFELPEQYAAELARYRQQKEAQQAALQQRQQNEQFVARVQNAVRKTDSLIAQRRNDPDFRYKYGVIKQKMQDQHFVNFMAQRFQPEQWPDQIMFMYDAISAPKRQQYPLRSTNTNLGRPHMTDNSGASILRKIEEMGL